MLCEKCNKNEATIHYTEVVDGRKTEHHLCGQCAAQLNLSGYAGLLDQDFPFVRLLTGLLASNEGNASAVDSPMDHVRCPQCNMTFKEFAQIGKFGCAGCYDVFGPLIEDNIKKIHGDVMHKGKVYKKSANEDKKDDEDKQVSDRILALMVKQKEAVELENYEMAAKYRDEIKALKERK